MIYPERITIDEFELIAMGTDEGLLDAESQLEVALARTPDVPRWTYYPADLTAERARVRVERSGAMFREGRSVRYGLWVDGVAQGTVGFGVGGEVDGGSTFYSLLESARGRGYVSRSVLKFAELLRAEGVRDFWLMTIEGNEASERIARRLGFEPAGETSEEYQGRTLQINKWKLELS